MTSAAAGKAGTSGLEGLSRDELVELLEGRGEGGIRIDFAGKDNARRIARQVRPRVARTIKKYCAGSEEEQARNLVVEGDNLQAMATLFRERGQVDLILTDPPYNTGNDWRYNDRWEDDPNDPGLGEWVRADDGARHTKWMRFMWPRLQMMKEMLKPDTGVLAICIDYREMFRLGQMLDELFGEGNRLGIVNWQRTYSRTNDATHLATTTEYVLVYANDADKTHTALLPRSEDEGVKANLDEDPEPWTDAPATGSNAKAHKSMVYGIQNPFTGEILYPPSGSAWRAEQAVNLENLSEWGCEYELRALDDAKIRAAVTGVPVEEVPDVKAIVLGEPVESARSKAEKVLDGVWPRLFFLKRGEGRPRRKKYLSELKEGIVPTTFWASEDFEEPIEIGAVSWPHKVSGHSQQGVDELTAVVGPGHGFKTVKPMKLFRRLIDLWCPPDGLVLDPFAGSGTTGHAVLEGNDQSPEADRRFILIEQGRPDRGDSYARSLTADRLQRAVSGAWSSGDRDPLPGGFRFAALGKKVDADALLSMEREDLADTLISSHFDASARQRVALVRVGPDDSYRHLVAKNSEGEGFFLIWSGNEDDADFDEDAYERCAAEAKQANLQPRYHVYARLYRFQTSNVVFYPIPDRILMDLGLDLRGEPYHADGEA